MKLNLEIIGNRRLINVMSLHEWLKYNKLDLNDIVKVEQAYFQNRAFLLEDRLHLILNEWLADPERLIEIGGYF